MPTQPYFNKSRQRVPSVTTILGRFKDSGGLIWWAYNTGVDHGHRQANGDPDAPTNLYEETKKACDVGTAVHARVEEYLKGEPISDWPHEFSDEQVGHANSAWGAFLEWWSSSMFQVVEQEIPLVHPTLGFGGTPDAICLVNGKYVMVDWKTSNGTYPDHLLQVAAYAAMWNRRFPKMRIEGHHLCRFAKENGDFSHLYLPDLSNEWEMFKHLRKAYDLDKLVKKRTR